ncbi:MAG: hypothetical protein E6G33_07440 [Actinobacteria bacterium]|nr:MAG: hypothetical protein E6G33_07440 [Actinomycetota bacterium]
MKRLIRLLACASVGVVLGVSVYVGLVQSGLAPSPFDPLVRGDIALARSARPGLRVLFVGNSFTFRNGLARMVHDLAVYDRGGPQLFAVEYAAPGWSFEDAANDDGLTRLLQDVRWNVVVLQEQSQLLSFAREEWQRETYPFARALQNEITRDGAHTLLFMTWGYKRGDQHNWPGDSFAGMQGRLSEGYSALAAELRASVAPAGLAWAEALRQRPGLDLWESDGKHPNRHGSYLAACVFYGILTGRDPVRSTFTAGLQPSDARFLQGVAHAIVQETQVSLPAVPRSATFATGP